MLYSIKNDLFMRFANRLQNVLLGQRIYIHVVERDTNQAQSKYMKKAWANTQGCVLTVANKAKNSLHKGESAEAERIYIEAVKLAGEKYPEKISVDKYVLEDGTTLVYVSEYKAPKVKKTIEDEPIATMPE